MYPTFEKTKREKSNRVRSGDSVGKYFEITFQGSIPAKKITFQGSIRAKKINFQGSIRAKKCTFPGKYLCKKKRLFQESVRAKGPRWLPSCVMGHLTSTLKYRQFPSYLLYLISFYLLLSPVYLTVFSFCFFPGFLTIFILLSSNSNNNVSCRVIFAFSLWNHKTFSIHEIFFGNESQFCCGPF